MLIYIYVNIIYAQKGSLYILIQGRKGYLMNNNIILSENREFEMVGHSPNYENFFFKVKRFGEDMKKELTVRVFGGIALPSGISLTSEERNKLHAKALYEYKKKYRF